MTRTKRTILFTAILCALIVLFSSCESREEKAYRSAAAEASRAAENAERAKKEYEELSEDISNYYRLKEALDNAN